MELSEEPLQESIPPAPSSPRRALHTFLFSHRVGQLFLLVGVWVLFYLFVIRGMSFYLVPSRSMEPILRVGDQLAALTEKDYVRGDIVVLHDPKEKGSHIVKRIVAVGGDRVTVGGGALFLNDDYVSEPYIAEPMKYAVVQEMVVPEGHFFFLGDNRNDSDDSHVDGTAIPSSEVAGKVYFIYYPFSRAGWVRSYPLAPVRDETAPPPGA